MVKYTVFEILVKKSIKKQIVTSITINDKDVCCNYYLRVVYFWDWAHTLIHETLISEYVLDVFMI